MQQHWQKAATANYEIARTYFTDLTFNIGVATGLPSAGLVVIDFDRGEPNPDEWPATFTVRGRRGVHLYYRDTVRRRSQTGWRATEAEQIDVKADRSLVVGPGSVVAGVEYVIERDLPIAQLPPYGFPEAVDNVIPRVPIRDFSGTESAILVEVAESLCDAMVREAEGGRNQRLFKLACMMSEMVAGGGLSRDRLNDLARAAMQAGLTREESLRTVGSAWRTVTNVSLT